MPDTRSIYTFFRYARNPLAVVREFDWVADGKSEWMTTFGAEQLALSADQRAVLAAIFQAGWESGKWPIFAFIDRPLRLVNVNVQTALQGLVPQYVRRDGMGPVFQPGETLKLTVRGVNEVPGRDSVIPVFIEVLGFLVSKESSYEPTTEQLEPKVSEGDVADFLTRDRPSEQAKKMASRLGLLIWEESGSWRSGFTMSADYGWSITVSSKIGRYQDVDNVQDYFDRSPQYVVAQPLTNISGEPVAQPESADGGTIDPRDVFIVHGRDDEAHRAVTEFLRALDLRPVPFEEMVSATGSAAPYVGHVVSLAFKLTHAVIVLLTPDDMAQLHPDLHEERDPEWERVLTGQARPNVLFEAGMALAIRPDRTVLVEIGATRQFSDVAGRHVLRLTGNAGSLHSLAQRLKDAGCPVNTSGTDWLDTNRFGKLLASQRAPSKAMMSLGRLDGLPQGTVLPSTPPAAEPRLTARLLAGGKDYLLELTNRGGVTLHDVFVELKPEVHH